VEHKVILPKLVIETFRKDRRYDPKCNGAHEERVVDEGHPRVDVPDAPTRGSVDRFVPVENQVDDCHEEECLSYSLTDVDDEIAEEKGIEGGIRRVNVVLDEDEDDPGDGAGGEEDLREEEDEVRKTASFSS